MQAPLKQNTQIVKDCVCSCRAWCRSLGKRSCIDPTCMFLSQSVSYFTVPPRAHPSTGMYLPFGTRMSGPWCVNVNQRTKRLCESCLMIVVTESAPSTMCLHGTGGCPPPARLGWAGAAGAAAGEAAGGRGAGGEVGGARAGDGSPGERARAWGRLRECGGCDAGRTGGVVC